MKKAKANRCVTSLADDELAALDALAERVGITRSMLVRQMIRGHLLTHPTAVWFGAFNGQRLDLWVKACHQAEDERLPLPAHTEQLVEGTSGRIVRIDLETAG